MANPFKRTCFPCYALPAGAKPEEVRAAAARAMFDGLTLPWTPAADFTYTKSANMKVTEFVKTAGTEYVGLPYTDGRGGILTWLQYFDFEKGTFAPPADRDFNSNLGNSCASAVANGWRAVIPDLTVSATYSFTPSRGCIPVGDYTISDVTAEDFRTVGTRETIAANGREKILECYALCKTADALLLVAYHSNAGNHAMMVAEEPTVVRTADGAIDPERSVMIIQDQRFRQKPHAVNGEMLLISGRVRTGVTFAQLIEEGYIPFTHAVFTGQQPYVPASVTVEGEAALANWDDLILSAPYPVIALTLRQTDAAGKVLREDRRVTFAVEFTNGVAHRFPLKKMPLPSPADGAKRLTLSVMVNTGEVFTPLVFDL